MPIYTLLPRSRRKKAHKLWIIYALFAYFPEVEDQGEGEAREITPEGFLPLAFYLS